MRKLYVMSKGIENQPRLIGILKETDEKKYTFEYKLNGKLQEWFLRIDEFPDITKTYEGKEVEDFINRMIPPPNHKLIKEFLEGANLTEYDVWEMLKVFGQRNMRQDAYLYEKIPEGAIIYESVEAAL